jgi:hypothetical protein
VRSKVDELLRREIAFPGYQDSVFTTTDISISGPSSLSRKDVAAAFDTMEVITVLGSWNPRTGGGIVFWDDVCVLELIPGATVMFPVGSKRYSLVAVAPHETRFVFRQYCHAGVLRWVEKGGRSDTEFDLGASDHEKDIWENIRAKRGHKMFSKLEDIFVI